jgi:hypothetical protein
LKIRGILLIFVSLLNVGSSVNIIKFYCNNTNVKQILDNVYTMWYNNNERRVII